MKKLLTFTDAVQDHTSTCLDSDVDCIQQSATDSFSLNMAKK